MDLLGMDIRNSWCIKNNLLKYELYSEGYSKGLGSIQPKAPVWQWGYAHPACFILNCRCLFSAIRLSSHKHTHILKAMNPCRQDLINTYDEIALFFGLPIKNSNKNKWASWARAGASRRNESAVQCHISIISDMSSACALANIRAIRKYGRKILNGQQQ